MCHFSVILLSFLSFDTGHRKATGQGKETSLALFGDQEHDLSGTHSLEAHIHWWQLDNFK